MSNTFEWAGSIDLNAACLFLHILAAPDGPKVVGKVPICYVAIWHGETALHAPLWPPRVADDQTLSRIVVTHSQYRMPTDHLFPLLGHVENPGLGHLLSLESFVNRKSENKGITVCQAGTHLINCIEAGVGEYLVVKGLGVTCLGGFGCKFGYIVGPVLLCANSLFVEGFDPVADHRPGVGLHRVFDDSLIVVDEEPAHVNEFHFVLLHQKLQSAGQCIGGATPKIRLVLNRRAAGTQVHLCREFDRNLPDRAINVVPLVRDVGEPTVDNVADCRGGWCE